MSQTAAPHAGLPVAAIHALPLGLSADRPPLTRRLLRAAVQGVPASHVHWFRWDGEDLAGTGSLYRCRCGVVRPGF